MMFIKNTYKLFLIFLFNIQIYFSLCYDTQYFFCNNRIYSDFSGLSYEQINNLCSLIIKDDRFVVLLTDKITYQDDYSYTIFSENFFNTQCIYNSINCIYSFAISIYVKGGRVLISAGTNAKKYVSQNQRMNIINSVIDYLKRGDYYIAISTTINLIRNIYPYSNNNNNNNYQNNHSSNSGGIGFFGILLIIICIIINYISLLLFFSKTRR